MTGEEISKATKRFLHTFDERKLYHFNSELYKRYKNDIEDFKTRSVLYSSALQKTISLVFKTDQLSEEEKTIFVYQNAVWFLSSILEYIKIWLMLLVDRSIVTFDPEKVMYGSLLKEICKALDYNESMKNTTFDNFQVDFRNAVFHVNYHITTKGIQYKNYKGETVDLTFDQLIERIHEAEVILNEITTFADNKSEELDKKAEELNEKAEEIQSQIDKLQGKSN